jgi:hypothetical protein
MILQLHQGLAVDRTYLIFESDKYSIAIPFDHMAQTAKATLTKQEMIDIRDAINEELRENNEI